MDPDEILFNVVWKCVDCPKAIHSLSVGRDKQYLLDQDHHPALFFLLLPVHSWILQMLKTAAPFECQWFSHCFVHGYSILWRKRISFLFLLALLVSQCVCSGKRFTKSSWEAEWSEANDQFLLGCSKKIKRKKERKGRRQKNEKKKRNKQKNI